MQGIQIGKKVVKTLFTDDMTLHRTLITSSENSKS